MDGDESENVQIVYSDKESLSEATEKESPVDSAELKLCAIITEGSLDFDGWTALIAAIEKTYPDDIEKICLVYESFLSKFPLCYGYWRKYADHKTHLCTIDKVVEVFERAVQSATYSVHVWVDYCSFSMSAFEDPCDVRRLFKRGLSFVGKDYLCHTLWDKFIEFELSHQQWSSLAHIYIQTLRFPTKKLHRYYDSFKKLVAVWEEEMECQSNTSNELQPMHDNEVPTSYKDDEIKSIIKELLDPSIGSARSNALSKYLSIGAHFYKTASQLDEKLSCFETHIRRSYFHVKPLDVSQLENWHHYLDFVEAQGDFDWAVKLNERCLIPCSNYPEFWMRYVEFMETKGGRELANFALDRATQIFLKRVPVIHLFNARFKEQVGDVLGSRAAVLQFDAESDSSFVENVIRKANMEKRLGNYVAASNIYIEALEMAAAKKKLQDLPLLYVHFSRLKFLTTDSADAARDILIDGIKHVCSCKLLLQELINFAMMHGGARHIVLIDSVIASTLFSELGVSQDLSAEEREEISNLHLEFVDLCGSIHDIRNAWNRHIKWFPFSLRTPATVAPSHVTIEERKENYVAMLQQSSRNCSDDCVTWHPSPDKIQLHPENHDTRSNEPTADQISNQNSPLQKNQDIESDHTATDQQEAEETRHQVQQVSEVSEQPKEDVAEPIVSSPNLLHEVANESESISASRGFPKNNLQEEYDHDSEQNVKPLSLERLSLNAEDNIAPSSVPTTSHDCEAPQETCTSNGSMESGRNTGNRRLYSQICNQTSDFANIQRQAASPSSSASHQNPTTHELWQPSMPANSSRNWHQMKYNNRMRRDSKFGFRGHSQKRPHQQRHNSSQQQYQRAEMGPQMPVSQGFAPSQNSQADQCNPASNQYQAHASLSQPHGSLMQNVQQPSLSQPSAQPVAYPQSQMVQYPTQGNLQYGTMQNSEAYNQMWQYYYYQQQQQQQFFLQQQQQLLQQQQQLDPQQQQLLQQQYQQQLQLQQQYFYQQQQQFQQLSEQQQQQFQQMSQQQQQEPDQAHLQQQQSQPQQLQQEQQIDQHQQFNSQQQLQQQQYLQQQQFQQQYLQQQQLLQQQQQHLLYLQQLQQSQMQKQGEEQEQPSKQQQQQQQEQVHEHHHHHKYYDSSSHLEVESRPWITESQSREVTPPQNDLTEATGSVVSAASPQRQERSPTISV